MACTLGMRVEPPTSTIWCTSFLDMCASRRTWVTGPRVFLKRSRLSSSNLARLTTREKSVPAESASQSIVADICTDRVRLAASHCRRSRWIARLSLAMSIPVLRRNCCMQWSMRRWSKSSPPRWVSPEVDRTSKTPPSMVRRDTSNVPPPRSKTRMLCSAVSRLSRPYAMAAAVGSLMTRSTVRPAMVPASLVACRCASLK
mmetsp:Transcript_35579/g.70042  ORF Transcript_35579/g.70042 Transcript_35579/m.70042 type:complete len:201 (-) Transcript_35579:557-1159(-)